VKSFGRVRTAVKRVMPAVEPPAAIGGALHAQLMHAAAQRKPRRGILFAFPRKIVEHPAMAAAAVVVLRRGGGASHTARAKAAAPKAGDAGGRGAGGGHDQAGAGGDAGGGRAGAGGEEQGAERGAAEAARRVQGRRARQG